MRGAIPSMHARDYIVGAASRPNSLACQAASQHHRPDIVRIFRDGLPRELRSFGGQILGRQVGAEALEAITVAELGLDWGLIRSRRQFLYAANASRSVLSYSAGLT